jgi:hypothetical protein
LGNASITNLEREEDMTRFTAKLSELFHGFSHSSRIGGARRRASDLLARSCQPVVQRLEARLVPSVSMIAGPDINITQSGSNEAETTIAVNPTNANNLFAIDTNTYQGHYSTDGGQTWNNSNMAGFTNSNGHDAQAIWDSLGNLFVTRMGTATQIEVGISNDGGATFSGVQIISNTNGNNTDQPTLAAGASGVSGTPGAVWVSWEQGGQIQASGAAVNGLGSWGTFSSPQTAGGSNNGDFGSISVGPGGQLLASYQDGLTGGASGGEGPGTISTNLDPDGLGSGGFNSAVTAHSTNVGGTTSVPPQPGPFNTGGRTIDAEANLAYDNSGGAHNGRVYMAYTDRTSVPTPANNNTDIFVIHSDDDGSTWSSPVRVNDDASSGATGATQYLPAIALDQSTGIVAVSWYDTRNSGTGTTRDTYGSVSVDGGSSWLTNVRLSAALSNPLSAAVGTFNSGDLDLMTYANGVFYRSWSDNSNSTGDNPAGAGKAYDIYTASVGVGTAPTVTPPSDQASAEGSAKAFDLGKFSDPDGGPWSVEVNWGDGTPDTKFSKGAAGTIETQNHTYGEEGNFTATVTVKDSLGFLGSANFNIVVSDPAVVQAGGAVSAVEGAAFANKSIAQFTDPGGAEPNAADSSGTISNHYSIDSINWGDGSPSDTSTGALSFSGTAGSKTDPFTVTGNHTYGEEGTYTITAVINHEGVFTNLTSTAIVSDPAVVASSISVTAKESIAFAAPVATFTDPGGAEPNAFDPTPGISSHYTASINFGDGTPVVPGVITYSGAAGSKAGVFTVTASHTFAEEGTFAVATTINHEGITTTVSNAASIRDNYGLLLLDPTDPQTLMVTGNGAVNVTNSGAVVVNSSSPRAYFLTGNAIVTSSEADVGIGGGVFGNGTLNLLEPEFNQEAATPDPFALPLPPVPAGSFAAVHVSKGVVTLSPGTYNGGISVDGSGAVTLLPGIYYMNGGGFAVSGHGSVTGAGVMIVNAPIKSSDTVSITGQASVSLTAPTGLSGALAGYNSIALMQAPASAIAISVTGQASVSITGTVYAPKALLKLDGNGVMAVSAFTGAQATLGGVVVANQAMITGNAALIVNADPATTIAASVSLSSVGGGLPIPTFNWSTVPGAASYSLILIDSTTNTVVTNTAVSGTSFKLATPLAAQDTYVWCIAAWKPNGELVTLSDSQALTLNQQVVQPSL